MKKILSIVICLIIATAPLSMNVAAKTVKPSKPKITSVTNVDTTTQKIKWSKVKNISGYKIYYKVSGGKYRTLKKVGKNVKSYTVKKLKTNKKYFYKIRAYKKSHGKTYYSKYSSVKGKKTTNYLMNLVQPYSIGTAYSFYYYSDYTDPNCVKLGGDEYTNGFGISNCFACFNLKAKYRKITFTVGIEDGDGLDGKISIISDGSVVTTINCEADALPKTYTVDIENAEQLKFQCYDGGNIALVNIKLYK